MVDLKMLVKSPSLAYTIESPVISYDFDFLLSSLIKNEVQNSKYQLEQKNIVHNKLLTIKN